MDLTKMKDADKLYLCRWYFKAGFCCLPFVWFVNTIWFFREAFSRPPYPEQKDIRKFVIFSGFGSLFWLIVITTWVYMFQTQRAKWGEWGDDLSFIPPTGRA